MWAALHVWERERIDYLTAPLKDYATKEQAEQALQGLSEADLVNISKIARVRLNAARRHDLEDFRQEAVARILSGSRRWPLHVPLPVFIVEVMRSIASDSNPHRNISVQQRTNRAADDPTEPVNSPLSNIAGTDSSPEDQVMAAETLEEIEALFKDDANALMVVMGKADGLSPMEIQEVSGMSTLEYESACRQVRRKLSAYKKAQQQ